MGAGRLCYSFGATIYGMLALFQFGYILSHFGMTNDFLSFYSVCRLILAIFQIPTHASVLFSARYTAETAEKVVVTLGVGDKERGLSIYYRLINACNFFISVFIFFGGMVLLKDGGRVGLTFVISEILSGSILTFVLVIRVYAAITNQVKDYFYLHPFTESRQGITLVEGGL